MKPTCHEETHLTYHFADVRGQRHAVKYGLGWWSEEKPWRTKTRSSTKWLQRRASKARRNASKAIIREEIANL